ncbi:MAG: hypothetical protein VX527_04475 [Planctomycetota bacterium]|nr:hypothetical protein [Planctomycetota bacterium]
MTTPTPTQALEDRLQKLESRLIDTRRSLRHTRRWLTMAGLAGFGLLIAAAADLATIDVIRTKRLEIVDNAGHVVLAAASDRTGGRVDLWTPEGCNVMRLTSNEHGGDLALWNCNGRSVAGLFATEQGGEATIWDNQGEVSVRVREGKTGGLVDLMESGTSRCMLYATETGGQLDLIDLKGTPTLMAYSDLDTAHIAMDRLHMTGTATKSSLIMTSENDTPTVSIKNGPGAELHLAGSTGHVTLEVPAGDVMPTIAIQNADGKTVAEMALREHGSGSLAALTAAGQQVASLRADKSGNGRIDLSDESGTIMASMQTRAQRGATLALMAPNGNNVCAMAASETGGVLNLSNGQGSPILVGGIPTGRRDGALSLYNQRGIPVVTAGSTVGGFGQLILNDDNGHRVMALPQRFTTSQLPPAKE